MLCIGEKAEILLLDNKWYPCIVTRSTYNKRYNVYLLQESDGFSKGHEFTQCAATHIRTKESVCPANISEDS